MTAETDELHSVLGSVVSKKLASSLFYMKVIRHSPAQGRPGD